MQYYNHFRPHQGIDGIPEKNLPDGVGNIQKKQILGGLHHHYYRSSAWSPSDGEKLHHGDGVNIFNYIEQAI